jgi:myosin heavy subunit
LFSIHLNGCKINFKIDLCDTLRVSKFEEERNYNIFYQILSDPTLTQKYELEDSNEYPITKNTLTIGDIDDNANFNELMVKY